MKNNKLFAILLLLPLSFLLISCTNTATGVSKDVHSNAQAVKRAVS